MANKSFEDVYDHVIPFLPGAEAPIVDQHIRRVLRDFFKRTTCWRETFKFDTNGINDTYHLWPTIGSVAKILLVYLDGSTRPAPVIPEHMRMEQLPPGKPQGWFGLTPQVITLRPSPTDVIPVEVHAAITIPVDLTTRTFPDDVFDDHIETIAAGIVGGMMLMPGKPWSQRDTGLLYSRMYGAAVAQIRSELRDGGQPNQSTFTPACKFGV